MEFVTGDLCEVIEPRARLFHAGDLCAGDVVRVERGVPDVDGDVFVSRRRDGHRAWILPENLRRHFSDTPGPDASAGVVQISAVRAALVALGIEADVVAVAQAIEGATR